MKMMLLTIATVLGISVLAGCMAQKTQLPPPKKFFYIIMILLTMKFIYDNIMF